MVMESVTVRIYGEQYTVKSSDDPEYIQNVARLVDEKMREIASGGKVVATSKIAILAALNIAGDLFQAKKELDAGNGDAEKRVDNVISRLSGLLEDQG